MSASFNNDQDQDAQFNEKTVFRSQKFPEVNESRCQTSTSSKSRHSHASRNHNSTSRHHQDASVDWPELGVKIEDWFDGARTPDQRIVYKFLSNIKSDDQDQSDNQSRLSSAMTDRSLRSMAKQAGGSAGDNAQSLENILDNLKKYRTKFNNKKDRSYSRRDNEHQESGLPRLARRSGSVSARPTGGNGEQQPTFESSTWRVMRHLKSADIRNKYPLPKANPDYHFRNATTFHTCGRPPKSTFLLHPDWV